MVLKLADRIAHVTGKLQELGFRDIVLITYRPSPLGVEGYYKLRAIKHNYRVFISELLFKAQ